MGEGGGGGGGGVGIFGFVDFANFGSVFALKTWLRFFGFSVFYGLGFFF